MSDKVEQRGQADPMAFDVSKAALPALWKSDPAFVELAKYLYGEDVTLESVQKDLFGKMDPSPSDLHAQQPLKRKKKAVVMDDRALESVGKAFIGLVEKAYDAGLIDDDGNLNEEEISKSRQYVRDHAGRFAGSGHHAGKMIAGLTAAGALAGTGAVVGSKAPGALKYAGESIKFVGHHLKSSDPVERHVARALLPHALKATGKAVGTAGVGAVAGAGGVYEGTRTYQDMRDHSVASKSWKEFDAKRKTRPHGVAADVADAVALGGLGAMAASPGMRRAGMRIGRRAEVRRMAAEGEGRLVDVMHQEDKVKRAQRITGDPVEERHKDTKNVRGFFRNEWKRSGTAGRTGMVGAATTLAAGSVADSQRSKQAHEDRLFTRFQAREKASKSADVTWEGDFSKVDEDKRQVFGWASVAEMDGKPVVDLQGDYIHPDDVEKAAYDYVLTSRVGGDMHYRVDENGNVIEKADRPLHVSDLIESVVFTPEKCEAMGISKSLSGRWWTGFQINDPDVWQDVKDGRRTGFSIHGAGMRKSIDIAELDPEAELIGKAYQESETVEEFIGNLETLHGVPGYEGFGDLAKHLHHGLDAPQVNPQQSRNAGVYGSTGMGLGAATGLAIGGKKGAEIGGLAGATAGTVTGAVAGREKKPPRPPSVEAAIGVHKAVDNTNRMGGSVGVRQNMYQQYALQQATDMLAPQVAQHIQSMQEQRWQQQMMEQQALQSQAQQGPQDFSVRMGPYANHSQGQTRSQQNPLAPSQQAPITGDTTPQMPQPQTFSV